MTNKVKEVIKIESFLQEKTAFESEPLVPADTFLYPRQEILSNKRLKAVRPKDQVEVLNKFFDLNLLSFD